MPLTPFQKHKIRRLFSVLDVSRDGRVDRSDFMRRVDQRGPGRGRKLPVRPAA